MSETAEATRKSDAWRKLPLTAIPGITTSDVEHIHRMMVNDVGELFDSLDFGDTLDLDRPKVANLLAAIAALQRGEIPAPLPEVAEVASVDEPVQTLATESIPESIPESIQANEPPTAPAEPESIKQESELPNSDSAASESKDSPEVQPDKEIASKAVLDNLAATIRLESDAYRDVRRRMILQLQKLDGLRANLREIEADHKEAKKSVEAAEAEMEAIIREQFEATSPNLFSPSAVPPPPDDPAATVPPEAIPTDLYPDTEPAPMPSPPEPEDLRWRDVPITRLMEPDINHDGVMKNRQVNALANHEQGINTVGQLIDYQTPQANGWVPRLNDIKGISTAGVDAISDCLERFWALWRNNREAAIGAAAQ